MNLRILSLIFEMHIYLCVAWEDLALLSAIGKQMGDTLNLMPNDRNFD